MTKASAFEHFLYLLSELERVIESGDVRLPDGQMEAIRIRLARVEAKLARSAHQTGRKPAAP